jgi:hypothetical protein
VKTGQRISICTAARCQFKGDHFHLSLPVDK